MNAIDRLSGGDETSERKGENICVTVLCICQRAS